jgi:hypothetical protein
MPGTETGVGSISGAASTNPPATRHSASILRRWTWGMERASVLAR